MNAIRLRSMVWFATGAVLALIMSFLVLDAWRADAGSPGADDSTFVPVTACRLVDTRPLPDRIGPNGSWSITDTKILQATGTNGNCTIPTTAVGLSMNVTAVSATADGFLTFWDTGPRPVASSLNPSVGQPPIPNAVNVKLAPNGSFMVYNKSGIVDVIIDVNGYYIKASLQDLNARLAALEAQQPPILVEHAELANVDEAIFGGGTAANVLTVTINAPTAGDLIINGAISAFGGTYDRFACSLLVDGVSQGGSVMWDQVHKPGGDHTDNYHSGCNPTLTKEVTAGVHTISLRVDDRATVEFDDASLWAIWTRT